MTQRKGRTTGIWLTAAALAAGIGGTSFAQDAPRDGKPGESAGADDLAAETAYLKAFFAEKELRDLARAEKEYAAVVDTKGAAHETVGRALLGRARCLQALGRGDDATAVLARIAKEFADVPDVAARASALAAPAVDQGLWNSIYGILFNANNDLEYAVRYGDRGVPVLADVLRYDNPTVVARAAEALLRIDSEASRRALVAGIADPEILQRRSLVLGALQTNLRVPDEVVLAGLRSRDPYTRRAGAGAASRQRGELTAEERSLLLSDADLLRAAVGDCRTEGAASVVATALASDDDVVRSVGLGVLADQTRRPTTRFLSLALADPPNALLERPEVLRAIAELVDGSVRKEPVGSVQPAVVPSLPLLQAMAKDDSLCDTALSWLLASEFEPGPEHRELLLRCWERARPGSFDASRARASRLVKVLGAPPSPEDLDIVVSRWPLQGERLASYAKNLLEAQGLDAGVLERLLASAGGLRPWLVDVAFAAVDSGRIPEAADVLVRNLEKLPTNDALAVLNGLSARRDQVRLADPEPVAAWLEHPNGGSHALSILSSQGGAGVRAMLPHLVPGSPMFSRTLKATAASKLPELRTRLSELLLTTEAPGELDALLSALLEGFGDTSAEALGDALRSLPETRASRVARAILESRSALSSSVRTGLIEVALSRDALVAWLPKMPQMWSTVDVTTHRRLALECLASEQEARQAWGAWAESTLRDDAAWDALMRVASESGIEARGYARQALRSIDTDREELRQVLALDGRRRARDGIAALLASEKPDDRRAGIAAVVATRADERIADLLRLATDDADDAVRGDARAALVALGTAAPSAASAKDATPPK